MTKGHDMENEKTCDEGCSGIGCDEAACVERDYE